MTIVKSSTFLLFSGLLWMRPAVFGECTVNNCIYTAKADLTINIAPDGSASPPCACVEKGKQVKFTTDAHATDFSADFTGPHPFAKNHHLHTKHLYPTDTAVNQVSSEYEACYYVGTDANCTGPKTDPKVIVKPVSMIAVSPDPVPNFDREHRRQVVRVTDTGPVSVKITNVEIKGEDVNFEQNGGCTGQTLEAERGYCEIVVTFTPRSGKSQAVLQIADDSGETATVQLIGSGN
jgi:hypothetical protein